MPEKSQLAIGIAGIWPEPIGGVSTTCYQLSLNLSALGFKVHFFDNLPGKSKMDVSELASYTALCRNWSQRTGVLGRLSRNRGKKLNKLLLSSIREMVAIPYFWSHPRQTITCFSFMVQMAEHWDTRGIRLLHGHHAGLLSWATMMVARYFLECPFVVTVYASEFTMPVNRPLVSVALDVCNKADAIMCISNYTFTQMKNAGCKNSRVSVIHLASAPEHNTKRSFEALEVTLSNLNLTTDAPMILYVGWLIERKGPQVLMQALSSLTNLSWQAVFVGPDHGLLGKLREQAITLGLDTRVRVVGPVNGDALLSLYDLADIFVFPTQSADEGFGIVGLEAMAHGVPVIASNTGAIPEVVVDSETGFLFPPGDAAALGNSLTKLLIDSSLRARMSKSAQARSQAFSWSITTKRLVHLYQQVIGGIR